MGFFDRFKKKKEPSKPVETKPTTPKIVPKPAPTKTKTTHREPTKPNPVEIETFETRTAHVEITKEKGKYPIKQVKRKEIHPNELTELDLLKEKQSNFYSVKLMDKNYYGSEESKIEAHKINDEKKEYLENNPKDFLIKGADLCGYVWDYVDTVPADEREIIELLGEGKYYEDNDDYETAIKIYKKADKLTQIVLKDEIELLKKEHGNRDYLYSAKAKNRINICYSLINRDKIKKLEGEAKELEETNPTKAIEKYKELNEVNPGLKKYDKAIFKILEAEAKELEKTNPPDAIKKYEYLNEVNPGLKKYDKRIEIVKKKLE